MNANAPQPSTCHHHPLSRCRKFLELAWDNLDLCLPSTESGLPFKPVYDASDLADFDPSVELGEPGEFPFTRGVYRRCTPGARGPCVNTPDLQCRGVERAVQATDRSGYNRAQRGVRPADADGLRLRPQVGHGEVGKVGVAIDWSTTCRSSSTGSRSTRSRRR